MYQSELLLLLLLLYYLCGVITGDKNRLTPPRDCDGIVHFLTIGDWLVALAGLRISCRLAAVAVSSLSSLPAVRRKLWISRLDEPVYLSPLVWFLMLPWFCFMCKFWLLAVRRIQISVFPHPSRGAFGSWLLVFVCAALMRIFAKLTSRSSIL